MILFVIGLLVSLIVLAKVKLISKLFLAVFVSYYSFGIFASFLVGINEELLTLYGACFISLSLALIIPTKNRVCFKPNIYRKEIKKNHFAKLCLYLTTMVAFLCYVIVIILHGLPMLNPSVRNEVSAYFTYFIALLWINFPLVFFYFSRKFVFIYIVFSFCIFLTMGYRTPILFVCIFFVLCNLSWIRLNITKKRLLLFLMFFVVITGVFASLRFEDTGKLNKIMNNLGVPHQFKYVAPIYFVFAEGYIVNSEILDINKKEGNQYGSFTGSAFLTILPGEQLHARNKLAFWMGRDNWQTSSTTPSLIGQLVLEVGQSLTVFLIFLIGCFVNSYSKRVKASTAISKFYPQTVLLSFLMLGIHTGILDPIIIFIMVNYFFYLCFLLLKSRF